MNGNNYPALIRGSFINGVTCAGLSGEFKAEFPGDTQNIVGSCGGEMGCHTATFTVVTEISPVGGVSPSAR